MSRKKPSDRFKEVRNASARRDYFIDDTLEAGIALKGTEVKSVRSGMAQINESFVRIDKGTPILYHSHIAEYAFGAHANHNPHRPRKLLLNKKEIHKWEQAVQSGSRTIIPLRMYFSHGLVKVEIALCRSKRQYDKREDLKKAADLRETQRTVKHHL